ncbi:MAG: zinc ribbon domain-containing protein [Planctomycetota bacterium]|nr:zinc ribbon domain-containing protein [Planctomycetota bacterium]
MSLSESSITEASTESIAPPADEPLLAATRFCDACGAPLDDHDRFCNSCGQPQASDAPLVDTKADEPRLFHCQNCGADLNIRDDQRSYVCPFCDSTYVVELETHGVVRQRPEFVIGFAITPEQAAERFKAWLNGGGWFRPGDLSQAEVTEKLRGVYLPFWTFNMLAESRWTASIGEFWYRTETYTVRVNGKTETRTRRVQETEWWPLTGEHHRYYSGYLVSASRGLPQKWADAVQPFQIAAMKRYEPFYLAGWMAEEYSLEREQAEALCRQKFTEWARRDIAAFMPGNTHRQLATDVEFSQINSDLVLLPIYLLSYRYQDKQYRFILNGQTGRIQGDRPLSYRRIGLAIAAAVVAIILIVLAVMWLSRSKHEVNGPPRFGNFRVEHAAPLDPVATTLPRQNRSPHLTDLCRYV